MGNRLKQILEAWGKGLGSAWDQVVMGILLIATAGMITYLLWPQPEYELTLTPLPDTQIATANTSDAPLAMSTIDTSEINTSEGFTATSHKSKHPHHPKKPKIVLKPGSLSLNTANAAQLDLLPGVGPKMAQRILAYRKEHGPFISLDDLQNVKGIGPKNFAKIKPFLKI